MRIFFSLAVALLLVPSCYASHGLGAIEARDAGPAISHDARPPAMSRDAGPLTCPSAASLGSPRDGIDVVTTFSGCDDRCIVVHDVAGPRRDIEDLERLRDGVTSISLATDVEVAPCCPSRPEVGLCLVVRGEPDSHTSWSECNGQPAFPPMWMFAVAEDPGCFAVRVER